MSSSMYSSSSGAPPAPAPPVLPDWLAIAQDHHRDGRLLDAAKAYRLTLATAPRSQAALFALSLIARQSNQLQPALKLAIAALAAGPESAIAWTNFGDLLISIREISRAQSAYRRALSLDSGIAAAHYGLGNTLAHQNNLYQFTEALASFRTAVQLAPKIPEFHFAQAFAHCKLGQHQPAIAAYRRAITLRPGFASAWLNLGVELIADGRPQLADLCYRQALAAPGTGTRISAHLNLGHLHRNRRSFPQAEAHYSQALQLAPSNHPRHAEVQLAFTYLHLEQAHFPQAWQSLHSAESADPNRQNPEIPNARGILLLAQHAAQPQPRVPQVSNLRPGITDLAISAIQAFEQAESLGHKSAASNRGNALLRLGRCEEALTAHQAAVNLDPHHPGARYNLALTQLRLGDYANGWPNYEIRWSFREVHPCPRRFSQPRWHGEPLQSSARLFVYAEQGLGDTMQFIRYLSLVAARLPGAHLIVEVQTPLVRLLTQLIANLPGVSAELIAFGSTIPNFTHHCPLMSLPAIFRTTLETVPNTTPYLAADPEHIQARKRELAPNLPAIGINWAGNPSYRADRERSTCLETFLPLLQIPGIQCVSLQKGEPALQIPPIRQSLPENCTFLDGCSSDRDFADTAALIANLDLVITTDTAVAHLAGALGKPLWLLLPWQSDWRWMQSRPTTPWYPTARLFRQSSANNWPELIDRVIHRAIHRVSRAIAEIPTRDPPSL